jgi:hypothetical protein
MTTIVAGLLPVALPKSFLHYSPGCGCTTALLICYSVHFKIERSEHLYPMKTARWLGEFVNRDWQSLTDCSPRPRIVGEMDNWLYWYDSLSPQAGNSVCRCTSACALGVEGSMLQGRALWALAYNCRSTPPPRVRGLLWNRRGRQCGHTSIEVARELRSPVWSFAASGVTISDTGRRHLYSLPRESNFFCCERGTYVWTDQSQFGTLRVTYGPTVFQCFQAWATATLSYTLSKNGVNSEQPKHRFPNLLTNETENLKFQLWYLHWGPTSKMKTEIDVQ